MTLNTFIRKVFFNNKFKFLGIIFMFIITIILFFSFDSEANAMKKIESDITTKYKQQDAKMDLFNTESSTYKTMMENIEKGNKNSKLPQLKSKIENKLSTKEVVEQLKSKYGKDLYFENRYSKEVNNPKLISQKDPASQSKKELPIIVEKQTHNISVPFIKKGTKSLKDDEIWIDDFISRKRNLKVGDKIKIEQKEYKISAIYGSPSKIMKQTFNYDGWAILNEKNYSSLKNEEKIELLSRKKSTKNEKYFSDLYTKISDDKRFVTNLQIPDINTNDLKDPLKMQKAIKDIKYKKRDIKLIQSVIELENDGEANVIHIQPDIHLVTSKFIAVIFTAILSILLTIIITKIITNYAVEIGVLKSFGYYKKEILSRFLILPVVISVIAITIGSLVGYFITSKLLLQALTNQFNVPSNVSPTINFTTIIFGVIIPFVVILISVLYNANKLINRKTIYLLQNISSSKISKISSFLNKFSKKMKMKRLMRLRLLFNGLSKTVAVFIGIAFSSMLVFYSIFFITSITHLSDNVFNVLSVKQIKYDAINQTKIKNDSKSVGQMQGISIIDIQRNKKIDKKPTKFVTENKPKFDLLLAFDPSNTEMKFEKDQLNMIKDGIMLSQSYNSDYGINKGDDIIIKLNSDRADEKRKNNTYEIKVKGFYDSAAPIFSFSNINYIKKQLKLDNTYNAVFTDKKSRLEQISNTKTTSTLDLKVIKEQSNTALSLLWIIVIIFGTVAFLILLPIILILSGIIIDDNRKNIGILKALGYRNKELSSMMINIYNSVVALGIIFGIGLGYLLTLYLFGLFKDFGMTISIYATIPSITIGALIIFIIYKLNIAIASRKIKKVIPIKELSSFT